MRKYIMFAQHRLLQKKNEFVIANAIPKEILFQEADMSYKKAEDILPMELIELIQQYVDGENIYIPRKAGNRKEWGGNTETKQVLFVRNEQIYADYRSGVTTSELAGKYYLSEKSIQRIVRQMRA